MARISMITYENADDYIRKAMDDHEAKGYRITNMKRTLLHSLTAFTSLEDGFYSLQKRLETFLDKRTVAFFAYAISTEDECIVCSAYFKNILDQWGIDFQHFTFTETEQLLIVLGREIVSGKGHVSDTILDQLQERFDEIQIVELVSFASMMVANNLFNNVLQIDSELLERSDGEN